MAKETLQQRKARAAKIAAILAKTYSDATVTLDFKTPLELLIATILAAQSTDKGVNLVTPPLFAKYTTALDWADVPQEVLEQEIRRTGFYRNKAKAVRGAAAMIVETFGGQVPRTMEELLLLPGVARKTANVVLGNAFGLNEGIAVDTHAIRVSGRLGLTEHADPVKIEKDLMEIIPRKEWTHFSHLLVFHGRKCCTARSPNCAGCPVNKLCPSAFTFGNAPKQNTKITKDTKNTKKEG
jgi:endonuclease III